MEKTGWRWRDNELNFVEFRKLNKEERTEYLLLLKGLPKELVSSTDEIILNLYASKDKPVTKFLSLLDD